MKWSFLCLCFVANACGAASQGSAPNELVLRGEGIAKQIQTSLAGTTGEFNSDSIGADGKGRAGCFIQLGPALGERRFEFSLPDRVVDLGYAGQIIYRINHVKLKTLDVASTEGNFVLTAAFAASDVALKGSHSALGDAAVPDISLDHMRLIIRLKPVVADGKITYDQPRVEFKADVDNTFIPRFSVMGETIDVMDTLTNYRRDLCTSIQKKIQLALDDPARKAALAKKIEEGIRSQVDGPSGRLVGLRFEGTNLVVQLRK
jgi:hypothetical protein